MYTYICIYIYVYIYIHIYTYFDDILMRSNLLHVIPERHRRSRHRIQRRFQHAAEDAGQDQVHGTGHIGPRGAAGWAGFHGKISDHVVKMWFLMMKYRTGHG